MLALDFDGTLAPIVLRPEDAAPHPGAIEALTRLAPRLRAVAVVTGRPAEQAVRLGGLDSVPDLVVAGNYGLEQLAGGQLRAGEPAPGLLAARPEVVALLAGAPAGVHLEDKRVSLVVHTRPAREPQAALDALREPLTAIARAHGLELLPGRLVLELRPPGVDKGDALRRLVEELRPGAVCFAGDDRGDLPAFAALAELRRAGLLTCAVAAASPEGPPELLDAADLVVDGPAGIAGLLTALADRVSPGRGA